MAQTKNAEVIEDTAVLAQVISLFKQLPPEERERVHKAIGAYFGLGDGKNEIFPTISVSDVAKKIKFSTVKHQDPKEFLVNKHPRDLLERVLCLAYYITYDMGLGSFSALHISKLNTEAAQTKLPEILVLKDALKWGYVSGGLSGKILLTKVGERLVEALPNFELANKYAVHHRSGGQPLLEKHG